MTEVRVASVEADEAAMRRACREGTAAYAVALEAAGYWRGDNRAKQSDLAKDRVVQFSTSEGTKQ